MGICVSKNDYFEQDFPSVPQPPKQSAKRHINQHLLDLKNIRKVPLLSLANNPLYVKRIEGLKGDSDSSQSVSPTWDESKACLPSARQSE